ncbi:MULTISPECIES: hypothetical protein [unclassified Acinetobacter]|uniref:hypothetical protein n=1 Tax=unclassified Acinetobacter TaxID=196816 RepID=UPI0019093DEE|nr:MULTISPECIES: hypothetical protein [unclassified Acinetobacter]MBK0062380.1 hypothetical protein [Acinetobacter sp. S55]MBK0066184.1 hypothetical protein [Acinetobacter sp. S54]
MKKLVLTTFICMLGLIGCSKEPKSSNDENTIQPAIAQEKPADREKTDEEKGLELLLSKQTLPDVISMLKPKMSDEFDAFPVAAGLMAIWMENHKTKISDIKNLESSSRGKILKDSFNERGKRLCVQGQIVEIEVDRSGGFPVYHAGIVTNYTDVTRVLAVGSTGDLTAESHGAFCGVVIGKIGFTNSTGGTTSAPYLVGLFDLPENR